MTDGAAIGVSLDFLAKLVDSTAEGIVAADADDTVVVYNRAAQQIFGYPPERVIGVRKFSDLYPPGSSDRVRELLRGPEHGGVGRVDTMRSEVLAEHGERVPVNMSAYVLDDLGAPAGTVAVYIDLRERLRVESRLAAAQEALELSEKRALVAQLAGTTAHELNQPLTIVLAFAELILRQEGLSKTLSRAANMIVSEAERMAEIVRKIGRITRFETKEYVGSASIIDLDKSTFEP